MTNLSVDLSLKGTLLDSGYESVLGRVDDSVWEGSSPEPEDKCWICEVSDKEYYAFHGKHLSLYFSPDLEGKLLTESVTEESVDFICSSCVKRLKGEGNTSKSLKSMKEFISSLGVDVSDPNFKGTPGRVSEYFGEHFLPRHLVLTLLDSYRVSTFPSSYSGVVSQAKIQANGICPHHLLPIFYEVTVGYVSEGVAIGLSKLSRITKLLGSLPLLQEDFTAELHYQLSCILSTPHVGVFVKGRHTCMSLRGVRSDVPTVTSLMSGYFYTDGDTRSEFLALTGD